MIVGVAYNKCNETFGKHTCNAPKKLATDGGKSITRFFSVLRKGRI